MIPDECGDIRVLSARIPRYWFGNGNILFSLKGSGKKNTNVANTLTNIQDNLANGYDLLGTLFLCLTLGSNLYMNDNDDDDVEDGNGDGSTVVNSMMHDTAKTYRKSWGQQPQKQQQQELFVACCKLRLNVQGSNSNKTMLRFNYYASLLCI
ncbi:hypothetical protein FF38_05546 [Lucilia cuprina]|uniref:Uncharacterized protein n=1 Tax=Lucilia cuprina TaxID=7375 RepID=A0A0L0C899_LUCCU|nr:hypothetical protein FF38_05546 [Lucilia cuprina]